MEFNETPAGLIDMLNRLDLYREIKWQSYDEEALQGYTHSLSDALCASSRLRDQNRSDAFGNEPWDSDSDHHYLMLDLDVESYLVPSSTPGHFHLYVRQAVPWQDLRKLIEALAACGIIEPGYANASLAREGTTLRLPWVHKKAGE